MNNQNKLVVDRNRNQPQYRSELPLWKVLVPRKVLAAGAVSLAAAGIGYGAFKKVESASAAYNLDQQLSQPIATVDHELADGQIDRSKVTVVASPEGYTTAWATAEAVTDGSVDPREPSDIISAQLDGAGAEQGQDVVLPRNDVPQQ